MDGDVINCPRYGRQTDPVFPKKFSESVTVDEIDWVCAIACGFSLRAGRVCAGCNQQSSVTATGHRAAKVSHLGRPDRPRVALALKKDGKAD
jgi:hypothetical protein